MNPNSSSIMEPHNIHSPSLKQKLKSSLKLPSCFVPHNDEPSVPPEYATPRLVRTTSGMGSSRAGQDHIAPDYHFKDRAKHFISSRLGGGPPRHRRRHSSADFHYDAASYSLNFDDGGIHEGNDCSHDDVPPLRNFSSRLPASPPPRTMPIKSPPPKSPPGMHPRALCL
ncbi:uncharacterized protein LOC116197693 [Punica granatum]|nr:uncharacterized protein LOC116197693 [Punica granatum]